MPIFSILPTIAGSYEELWAIINFFRKDGIAALVKSALSPVELVKLSTPSTERIDVFIDYLNKSLFPNGETFSNLIGRRPFLILNAADMVEGTPFAFTQNNFSLLCSDMSKMPLAVGVAASAAFPVALSPVTLKNYSRCPEEQQTHWPPLWAANAADSVWKDNPERVALGRVQSAYALNADKDYIHLLDGGIADNLGLAEPYRILTSTSPAPGLLNQIAQGRIKNIVFVMINSRAAPGSKLDKTQATPGAVDMLLGTVNASIDRASSGSAFRLRTALGAAFSNYAALLKATDPMAAARMGTAADRAALIEVDFDAIEDAGCRKAFHSIGTSWTNGRREIDALLLMGHALMLQDNEFPKALDELQAHYTGAKPTVLQACQRLNAE